MFLSAGFLVACVAGVLNEDGALLQRHRFESLAEMSEGSEVGKAVIPTPDFQNKVEVGRKLQTELPFEMLVQMPLSQSGIKVDPDGTSITMDVDNFYSGQAVRSTHTVGSYEFGNLRWAIGDQDREFTAFPGTSVAVAERFHVYDHDGSWPTVDLEKVQSWQADPAFGQTEKMARALVQKRTGGLLGYLAEGRLSSYWLGGFYDPTTVSQLKDHLKTSEYDASLDERVNQMVANMTRQKASVSDWSQPSSIGTSCIHWDIADVDTTKAATHMTFPLQKEILSFRGQTVFSPQGRFSIVAGKSSFTLDGKGNLLWYYGGVTYGSVSPRTNGRFAGGDGYSESPVLYVAPVKGESHHQMQHFDARLLGPFGDLVRRLENQTFVDSMQKMFHQLSGVPLSYTYLYQNADDACPADLLAKMQSVADHLDFHAMLRRGPSPQESHMMAGHMIQILPCVISFLRGAVDESNGIDLLEGSVYHHFMMEMKNHQRLRAIRGSTEPEAGWHFKTMPSESP